TTPEDNPRIESVRAVERTFEAKVREKGAERAGVGKVIPPDAMQIITAQFLAGLSSDQRSTLTSAAQELSKIHGGDACQTEAHAARKEKAGFDIFHPISSAIGSAAESKAQEMSDKPVFAFAE